MIWEDTLEHARRLSAGAAALTLRHHDAKIIARAWAAAGDAWDVAGDAAEEAGLSGTAESARRTAGVNRQLVRSTLATPFGIARGIVFDPTDELPLSWSIYRQNPRTREAGLTYDTMDATFGQVVKFVREYLPAQPLVVQGRRLRLLVDESPDRNGAYEVFDVYGSRSSLRAVVRALERGGRRP